MTSTVMPRRQTDDQQALAEAVRRFLEAKSPEHRVRQAMATETGFDPALWQETGGGLGLCGLMVPDRYGGAGATFAEVSVVLEELGRSLACLPFFSTVVLAQTTLLTADDPAAAERWLPDLAAGQLRATLAFAEPGDQWASFATAATAVSDGPRWWLSGCKTHVLDGHTADIVFVTARTDRGPTLFAVDRSAPGLTATPLPVLDQTRKQARLDLDEVPAVQVGAAGDASRVLRRVLTVAAVALATEQVGGGQRVLEMAVGYAGTRVQFGRPIGSFQAIKNKCVDMFIAVESGRVAAARAVQAVAGQWPDLPALASLAKAHCSDAYWAAACENIQVHGGIGFTWEHPAHLYFRRAKSAKLMFGTPNYHRELLAREIGI